MRRFEQGGKFWEIEVVGSRFITRVGRIGKPAEGASRSFGSEQEAREAADAMIDFKRTSGFREVSAESADHEPAANAAANPDLEAAIAADLDDDQRYLVYGDWLESHGNPRGQLIAIQAAMRAGKDPVRYFDLKREETRILERNREVLLGPLDPERAQKFEWRLGFVHRIGLKGFFRGVAATFPEDEERNEDARLAMLDGGLGHPSMRFLRILSVATAELPRLVEILVRRKPPLLEELELAHHFVQPPGMPPPAVSLEALWPALPGLRRLSVDGLGLSVGAIALPRLRRLKLDRFVNEPLLVAICAGGLPALERLELALGAPSFPRVLLRPILEGSALPALTELSLSELGPDDAAIDALLASPLLSRLKRLELPDVHVHRGLVDRLRAHAASLSRLKLDLRGATILATFETELRRAIPTIELTAHRPPRERTEGDDRYDEVEE